MSSILLDDDGDFDFSSRGWKITKDLATLAIQTLRGRLNTFLGEWAFDTRIGFPWIQSVLVKGADFRIIRLLLKRAILSAPMVEQLPGVLLTFDPAARELSYSFSAQLNDGSTLEVGYGTPFVLIANKTENAVS